MRTIVQILTDLRANVEAMKSCATTDTDGMAALMAKDKALKEELAAARAAEEAERLLVAQEVRKEAKKGNRFSLARFIAGVADRHLEGLEAEVAEAGAAEYRRIGLSQKGKVIPSALLRDVHGQNFADDDEGGYLGITTLRYIEDVKERLVVAGMGATVLPGLVGQVSLPSMGSVTATFLDEGVASQTKVADVANVVLTPRGIRASMVTTRDLLKQTTVAVDRILEQRLADAAAACLDKEALAAIVTAATAAGSSVTWANIVAMETAINAANANRGSMGYVFTANTWGAAKTTLKSAGVGGYLLDIDGKVNGYKADFSNQLASADAIFGNFQDLYIGQWGGIDFVVDEVTLGDTGEIKVLLFNYADAKVAFAKSFSKIAASGSGSGDGQSA
jgi:HK97 family phage major capsid protein